MLVAILYVLPKGGNKKRFDDLNSRIANTSSANNCQIKSCDVFTACFIFYISFIAVGQ